MSSWTTELLRSTNCSTVNKASQGHCLRAVPADTLATLRANVGVLVKDGTYLVTNKLPLNVSGGVAHVHLMIGSMCDDAASFAPFLATTNLNAEIKNMAFYTSPGQGTNAITALGQFPESTTANAVLNVFNSTSHILRHSAAQMLLLHMQDFTTSCSSLISTILSLTGHISLSIGIPIQQCVIHLQQLITLTVILPWSTSNVTLGIYSMKVSNAFLSETAHGMYPTDTLSSYTFGTIGFIGLPLRDDDDL